MRADTPPSASSTEAGRVDERRRKILDAATRCIRRYSAKKVAVEDIALEAGISRRTLYRFYSGRREIMAALVYDRLTKIAAGVKAALRLCETFEDAVIVGTVETIRLARADRVFESLVEEDRTLTLDPDPHDANGPIRSLSASIWLAVFQDARKKGVLRATIAEQEALDWLIEIHRLLEVRADLTDAEMEDMLRKFVLTSLMPDQARPLERPKKR